MKTLSSPWAIIKKSWKTFFDKENFKFFVMIYLPLLPFSALSVVQSVYFNTQDKDVMSTQLAQFFTQYAWIFIPLIIIVLIGLVVSFWVGVSGIMAVSGVVEGRKEDMRQIYRSSWKMLWGYALLGIASGFLVLLGFIALVIPGIIIATWLHFANFEFIVAKKGIKGSMSGSKNLVKGNFFKVLGRVIVFDLFISVVQFGFQIIPFGIGSLVFSLFGALVILPHYYLYKELSL